MNLITDAVFLAWAAEEGLLPDPAHPGSEQLVFAQSLDTRRVWLPPNEPNALPKFITTAIQLASPGGPWRLRLRGGGPFYGDPHSPREQIIARTLRCVNVPPRTTGALEFTNEERDYVLMLAVIFLVFGYRVQTDLEVVTPERTCSPMFSHHGDLEIHFASAAALDEFVTGMRREGYALPDDELDAG